MNDKEQISSKIAFDEPPYINFDLTCRLTTFLFLLSLPYLVWEIYWAKEVGYVFIKWHTHLAFWFYLWLYTYMLLSVLNNWFFFKEYIKYQIVIASLGFTLLVFEAILITTGLGDTYMEKQHLGYLSRYDTKYETYYRQHKPFAKYDITRPEFNYSRQCNSLGFPDIEWTLKKKPKEKRILFGGDSFTEGVGAPFDSGYVSMLRSLLIAKDSSYYLMNSGIAGDDPCVNFVNYRDRLLSYNPDIIVQTLSSNDINTDMAVKGGLERFQKDGTIKFPSPPWWEPIYALSYVSRILFKSLGYNELLIKNPLTQKEKTILNKKTIALFTAYAQEAKTNKTKLLIILQPHQGEIYKQEYEYDFIPIIKELRTLDNVSVFDLIPYYLADFTKKKEDIRTYYWKQDGHHNSKGYSLMAKGVEEALNSFYADRKKDSI